MSALTLYVATGSLGAGVLLVVIGNAMANGWREVSLLPMVISYLGVCLLMGTVFGVMLYFNRGG